MTKRNESDATGGPSEGEIAAAEALLPEVAGKAEPSAADAVVPATDAHARLFETAHLEKDLKGRTVRAGAVTVTAQTVKFVLGMGSMVVLARLLAPEVYGLVAMVTAVTGFVALFRDLGLSMATVQRPRITHAQVSTLFWLNLGLGTGVAVLTALLAPVLAWFYREPRLLWITVALAGTFVISGAAVQHVALLKRQMNFMALAVADVGSLAVGSAVGIVAALAGMNYWALVVMQVVSAAVYSAVAVASGRWMPGPPVRGAGVMSMVKFGGHFTASNVLHYLGRNMDNVLIGRVWGAASLGIYTKAYGLLLLPMNQLLMPVSSVAIPALSRVGDDPVRLRRTYLMVLEKVALVSMPLVAVMAVTADWLVLVALGPQWIGAARIFQVLGLVAIVQPVAATASWLFIAAGRSDQLMRWSIFGNALVLVAIVAGLPWGPLGVAVSYALSGLLVRTPLMFWYAGRGGIVSQVDYYRTIWRWALLTALTMAAMLAGRRLLGDVNPALGLAAISALGGTIYLGLMMAFPFGRRALGEMRDLTGELRTRRKGKKE